MKIKDIFGCSLTFEEKNILNADTIYKKESDVNLLIKRSQDIEKMKCILFTKKQRKLLDLMKPSLMDLDEENEEKSIKHGSFSETMNRSLDINNNKENRKEEIKEILKSYQDQMKSDISKISNIDRRIIEYLNER